MADKRAMMNWIDRKICMPPLGERILVFSPNYTEGQTMRYRTIDSQFFRLMTEATHWATLEAPSDEQCY
jgi:hypothetical protein